MNWGWKIAISYIAFALLVLSLVFMSYTRKVNLVEEDYYEKEIQYQSQINRIKNTAELAGDVMVKYSAKTNIIAVHLPADEIDITKGSIHLFRPSDGDLDKIIPLDLDEEGIQELNVASLLPGLWNVKITWESGGKSYFTKESVHLM